MAWSSENEACSSILDFLHWLNYLCVSARPRACRRRGRELAEEREEGERVGEGGTWRKRGRGEG